MPIEQKKYATTKPDDSQLESAILSHRHQSILEGAFPHSPIHGSNITYEVGQVQGPGPPKYPMRMALLTNLIRNGGLMVKLQ